MTVNMPSLSFQAINARGTGVYELILFASGGCIVAGALLPIMGPDPPLWGVSLLVLAIGIGGLGWVFRALPRTSYFVYFTLDQSGIHHRTSPLSSMDLISWARVRGVEASYGMSELEVDGIELKVLSTTGYPDSRFLAMYSRHQIDQAVSAIREVVTTASPTDFASEADAVQA